MKLTRQKFLLLWLASALLVTGVRLLNSTDLGYDLTLQFQAAQHLSEGKGLSIFYPDSADGGDLSHPRQLKALIIFACGYPLLASALISLGVSLGAIVKVLGAPATLLGWWGWGRLAYEFMKDGLNRGGLFGVLGGLVAIICPLLFTERWQGTDIFFWAATPWVLQWLVRAASGSSPEAARLDTAAGLLSGFCLLMRYASASLVGYGFALILFQSGLRLRVLCRRWACFLGGVIPALLLQYYANHFLANAVISRPPLNFQGGIIQRLERLWQGLPLFGTANYVAAHWAPHQLIALLTQTLNHAPWLVVPTLVLFCSPLLLIRMHGQSLSHAFCDLRVASAAFIVVIPLFLWGCMMFGNHVYVGDQRYYETVIPIVVLIAYSISLPSARQTETLTRVVQQGGWAYLLAFVLLGASETGLMLTPTVRGAGERRKLVAQDSLEHWPSGGTTFGYSEARSCLLDLLSKRPGALLLTGAENYFFAEPRVDRSRLYPLWNIEIYDCVSGPADMLIFVRDFGGELEDLPLGSWDGKVIKSDFLRRLPNLHLVRRFPEEKLKILEASVPAGARVSLQSPPVSAQID